MRMRWMTGAAALAIGGLLVAGCEDPSAAEDGGDEAAAASEAGGEAAEETASAGEAADATDAASPASATAAFETTWLEIGGDGAQLEILEGGTVRTNVPGLERGTWRADGEGVVLTFTGRNSVDLPGRIEDDLLLLTTPDGEVGRFQRADAGGGSAAGSPPASRGGKG